MTDNNIDVNIVPVKNGAKRVVVSYYHYSREDKNHMSSQTDYVNNRDAYTGRFGAFIQRHLHGKGRRIISSCLG